MKNSDMRIALDELPSTNDYAKEKRGEGKPLFITAKRQSGGRGTKGRSFSSGEGGVYLSWLRFPKKLSAKRAFTVMSGAAVAVCETLRAYGLSPCVKWPNDIHVNGKKICGILIENTFSGGYIASSIVGVGLNVTNELPAELNEIATTMQREGVAPPVEEVIERLIANLQREYTMENYRGYLGCVGREITLLTGVQRIPATLLSVTDEGNLAVEIDGEYQEIAAAEVSVRV